MGVYEGTVGNLCGYEKLIIKSNKQMGCITNLNKTEIVIYLIKSQLSNQMAEI